MSQLPAFLLACLALMAAPGPTNALAAAAGAQRGWRKALPLAIAVLAAYALAVGMWLLLMQFAAASQHWLPTAAKLVAVLFLMRAAWRLWRSAGGQTAAGVSMTQLATVTLLNPKALVFAFAIFPPLNWPEIMPFIAGFAVLVLVCTGGWMALGATAAMTTGWFNAGRVNRITAVVLVVFAALLLAQMLLH